MMIWFSGYDRIVVLAEIHNLQTLVAQGCAKYELYGIQSRGTVFGDNI
jgi:hypothetical protein